MHELEVTVYGWKVLLVIDAATKISLAVKVLQIHEHEGLWARASVTQTRTKLAGAARLHKVVLEKGCLDGTDLWWLAQQGIAIIVPAQAHRAMTADAAAQSTAEVTITAGRRMHTVCLGGGGRAWTEHLKTQLMCAADLNTI
jgi:hypothetical protein